MLRAVGRAFVWAFGHPANWLWHHLVLPVLRFASAGLGGSGWAVAILLAIGLGVLVGVLLLRRRSRVAGVPKPEGSVSAAVRPTDLERAAEAAEAAGDNELAVRLRFQLGLARLEARGVISDQLTTTSRQLRQMLRSGVFDELAARHESIAYARQEASPGDVASARRGWDELLSEPGMTRGARETDAEPAGSRR